MKIEIDKSFVRDSKKVKDKKLLGRLADSIEQVKQAETISDIRSIKKLKGSEKHYRIRLSEYRIGIFVEDDTVYFVRFLVRKHIYRYFP